MKIDFSVREGDGWKLFNTVVTNADGRTDGPILKNEDSKASEYELLFHIEEYYDKQNLPPRQPPAWSTASPSASLFSTLATLPRADTVHAWNCSTYRGS